MAIPHATTTITVTRHELLATDDPYDTPSGTPTTVAAGVRANISVADGDEQVTGRSARETITFRLRADPVDLVHGDTVTDDATSENYAVVFARTRRTGDVGMDHTIAELRQVTGNREGET